MHDRKFLTRCLQLATYAAGKTYPNPMVGAVIVHEGRIIGEGFHHKAGEPHAEVMAVQSVKNKDLLKESTLYCSLEPCSHFGKTPPCSLLITQVGIPKVVIGCVDTHSKVAGKGIDHLRQHGVEVEMAKDPIPFEALNRVFFTNKNSGRPYFSLKWAQSLDGYIDINRNLSDSPTKISGPIARLNTHRLRAQVDGILVSSKTFMYDRASLNVRNWHGSNPRPIILIGDNFLPSNQDLQQLESTPILVGKTSSYTNYFESIECDWHTDDGWVNELLNRGVHHVLIEGGGQVLQWFLDHKLADEIHRYTANLTLQEGPFAPELPASDLVRLNLGNDTYERSL